MGFKRNQTYYLAFALLAIAGGLALYYFPKGYLVRELNGYHTPFLDLLFKYGTELGHGATYVGFCLSLLLARYRYFWTAVLGILLSTAAVQGLKRTLFHDSPRPVRFFAEEFGDRYAERLVRVEGVEPHLNDSFPSGHTATAFLIATLLALFTRSRLLGLYVLLTACLVGLSRMYLLHHFYEDVYFGAIFGVLSGTLAYAVSELFPTARYPSLERSLRKRKITDSDALPSESAGA